MADLFHSSKLRLERAKEHIIELEKRITEFFCTKPYPFAIDSYPEAIEQTFGIKFTKLLPNNLITVTGDTIDNLRSALDHALYAVAIASGMSPTKETKFPFADRESKFNSIILKGFSNFPDEIIALLRTFKPYKGGDNLLWALNRICATNKHRILTPIGIVVSGSHVYHAIRHEQGEIVHTKPMWNSGKNKIIFNISDTNTSSEYNIYFRFNIPFNEINAIGFQPAVTVLNALASKVEDILNALEGTTRKLGYI